MLRRSSSDPTRGLEQLVAACEAGLDLPAILSTASAAVATALGASQVSAYTLSEDGEVFVRVAGEGPEQLPPTRAPSRRSTAPRSACRW